MQIIEFVILGALAAFVLYQLYAVLGKRVGRQPGDQPAAPAAGSAAAAVQAAPPAGPSFPGLDELRARDPAFDPAKFLQGAQVAYETVVRAFAVGDREELRSLVAPEVLPNFETAITQRESEGRTEKVEFQHAPRADIQSAELQGDRARIQVRFLAEFRSRSTGPEGEAVDDRRTADLWTFERILGSADPNWTLARVDAAEA